MAARDVASLSELLLLGHPPGDQRGGGLEGDEHDGRADQHGQPELHVDHEQRDGAHRGRGHRSGDARHVVEQVGGVVGVVDGHGEQVSRPAGLS
ncbi:hypothetical protein ACFSTC_40055 [Nonomuraea ferruginea]